MKNWTIAIGLCAIVAGCGLRFDLHDYYFPYPQLTEGKVYVYRSLQHNAPEMHYYRTIPTDSADYLTITTYDMYGNQTQLTTHRIVPTGAKLHQQRIVAYDTTTGKSVVVKAEITHNDVFPFEVADTNAAYLYKISWTDALSPQTSYSILRNRFFKGFSDYFYRGKLYECAEFEVLERVVVRDGDTDQAFETESRELYAKGIGLLYYRKKIGKVRWEYELDDRITMEAFEKRVQLYQ